MDKLCVLRAVSTGDNAHSSSGYFMLTGVPHSPMNVENANPGAPNDWPNIAAVVRRMRGDSRRPAGGRAPADAHLQHRQSVWPGQDAGFLGRGVDPWLFRCEPGAAKFRIPEFTLAADVAVDRLGERRDLLQQLDRKLAARRIATRGASARDSRRRSTC